MVAAGEVAKAMDQYDRIYSTRVVASGSADLALHLERNWEPYALSVVAVPGTNKLGGPQVIVQAFVAVRKLHDRGKLPDEDESIEAHGAQVEPDLTEEGTV